MSPYACPLNKESSEDTRDLVLAEVKDVFKVTTGSYRPFNYTPDRESVMERI